MGTERSGYRAEVDAARSVLVELCGLLGAYRDDIVVIGGWVPELLLAGGPVRHVGSTDVDLALNHRTLHEASYRTIQELLLARGYCQGRQPFIYQRSVAVSERQVVVQVDLLAGEYEGTGAGHRHQNVQGVHARKARGCDLAFEMNTEITLRGTLPEGGEDSVQVRVASIVPFIVMKGMALADRRKEKDAWDIYFCLRHYPGGLEALASEFMPHMGHGLVREGLQNIAAKFESPAHIGPKFVADFEALTDVDARALRQRDAYERVSYLLRRLDM